MIFLNATEHLFHVRLGEVYQNRTSVWTVVWVVAFRELIEKLSS